MQHPHIQIIVGDDAVPATLQAALHQTAATKSFLPLARLSNRTRPTPADAYVIVAPANVNGAGELIRQFLDHLADRPRATLVITPDGKPLARIEHPATVPVTFIGAASAEELSIRLRMMLEMRSSLESLHRGMITTRRQETSAARRFQHQLRLASQVQREFLPDRMPRFGRLGFQTLYRPIDYVSGDLYDIHRLDDTHVGVAVADASGHGIPAALLTVFIKRALRAKESARGGLPLLSPREVLLRLNQDILEADLTECRFVATSYAVINAQTLEVEIARGGAPYPLVRRATGEVEFVDVEGPVVGVLEDADFETTTLQLTAGDSLMFLTDGIDRLAGSRPTTMLPPSPRKFAPSAPTMFGSPYSASDTSLALLEPATSTALLESDDEPKPTWLTLLETHGVSAAIDELSQRFDTLRRLGRTLDDLTVLAVNVS